MGYAMISKTCEKCGKVIEGYTLDQVNYMMRQHDLAKHEKVNEA